MGTDFKVKLLYRKLTDALHFDVRVHGGLYVCFLSHEGELSIGRAGTTETLRANPILTAE